MMTEMSAAARCAAIEEQIAKCNSQLRELNAQDPQSPKQLQGLRTSQDWTQTQRDRLIAQRVGFSAELALDRCADLEKSVEELSPEFRVFLKL